MPACVHCGEQVQPWESATAYSPVHPECLFRMVAGSAAHQLKQCSCFGGAWEDPPELTTREAARLAWDYWKEQHPDA